MFYINFLSTNYSHWSIRTIANIRLRFFVISLSCRLHHSRGSLDKHLIAIGSPYTLGVDLMNISLSYFMSAKNFVSHECQTRTIEAARWRIKCVTTILSPDSIILRPSKSLYLAGKKSKESISAL